MDALIQKLHGVVEAVAPIFGVSVGDTLNKATWRIDFKPEATQQQRDDAAAVVAAFDVAAEEATLQAAEDAKKAKKALLLATPNKSVTVQDLLDLGLLRE